MLSDGFDIHDNMNILNEYFEYRHKHFHSAKYFAPEYSGA